MEVEKNRFNDGFFLHSLFPLTVVKECSMNSEILSSSAAHSPGAQQEPEVQELQLPRVCQRQEEELADGAAVGHLVLLGIRTCGHKNCLRSRKVGTRLHS